MDCSRMEAIQLGPALLRGSPAGAWQRGPHGCPGRAAGALQSSGLSPLPSQRHWLLARAQHGGRPGISDGPCLLLASLRLELGEGGGSSSSRDQKPPGLQHTPAGPGVATRSPLFLLSAWQWSSRYIFFLLDFVCKLFLTMHGLWSFWHQPSPAGKLLV